MAVLLLCCFSLSAQPPIQWQKAFGGGQDENSRSIRQTKDGGYVIVGAGMSSDGDVTGNAGMIDYWVVKTGADGNLQWQKSLGGSLQEMAYSVEQTADDGYIVTGYATSTDGMVTGNQGFTDFWVTKLDAGGNLQWAKAFGGTYHDNGHMVFQTPDLGFIVAGGAYSSDLDVTGNHGGFDGWVIKLDAQGNITWKQCYGGTNTDDINSIAPAPGGGYIMTGYTLSNDGDIDANKGNGDLWVIKIDALGKIQWQKTFGGTDFESSEKVITTADGGYLVLGSTSSTNGDIAGNHGDVDVLVLKLDAGGNLQWQKCYGGTGLDLGVSIIKTSGDGYVIGAQATIANGDVTNVKGERDFWLIKITGTGAMQWQKTYGGSGMDMLSDIVATTDGWFIASGSTNSQDGDVTGVHGLSFDYWVVKFGPDPKCSPAITVNASSNNICANTSVKFTATVVNAGINGRYKWKRNSITETANSSTYTPATPLHNGDVIVCEYSCVTPCGKDTTIVSEPVTIAVINDVMPTVTISASETSICAGQSVNFTANGSYGNMTPAYQWFINGTAVGNNSTAFSSNILTNLAQVKCVLTITTPACQGTIQAQSNIITMAVAATGKPQINIAASDSIICKGATVNFNATSNGGSNAIYRWSINGMAAGANGPIFSTSTLNDGDVVRCALQVDTAMKCLTGTNAASNSIKVKVTDTKMPSISIVANTQEICAGMPVLFTASAQNVGTITQYQWAVNDSNAGNNDVVFMADRLKHNDIVTCSLHTDIPGCNPLEPVFSNAILVAVKDTPLISFAPAEITIMAGRQTELHATVSGDINGYDWAPASLLTGTQTLTPTTIPLSANTSFKLKVVATNGCESTKAIDVKVFTDLYIPNAFTPNGDGKNDVFKIPAGAAFTLQAFIIFDRWGNKVFSASDISKGWDGTRHGKLLETGAYAYLITGTNDKGKVMLKGTVMLIR